MVARGTRKQNARNLLHFTRTILFLELLQKEHCYFRKLKDRENSVTLLSSSERQHREISLQAVRMKSKELPFAFLVLRL